MIKSVSSDKSIVSGSEVPMLTPDQVVEQLRALRLQIPEFVQLPAEQVRQMRRSQACSVNPAFTHEAITIVGSSNLVRDAIGNSPEELHQAEDELARWTAVENEFRATLRGMVAANLVRRDRLGRAALQAYSLGRQLARQEDHAQLLPHVENMSRMRRFARRRTKPPEVEAVPPKAAVAS